MSFYAFTSNRDHLEKTGTSPLLEMQVCRVHRDHEDHLGPLEKESVLQKKCV